MSLHRFIQSPSLVSCLGNHSGPTDAQKEVHALTHSAIAGSSRDYRRLGLLRVMEHTTPHSNDLMEFVGILRMARLQPTEVTIHTTTPTQVDFVTRNNIPLTLIWDRQTRENEGLTTYHLGRTGDKKVLSLTSRHTLVEQLRRAAGGLPTLEPLQLWPSSR